MEPVLSIIIPVFNAEFFIERCLFSIIKGQPDLPPYEIICIDNGSTDRSYYKIAGLAAIFSNIKLLSSDKGVSRARNKGLDNAIGKYIIFVDADDFWVPDSVSQLLLTMENENLDSLRFGIKRTTRDTLDVQEKEYKLKAFSRFDYYKNNNHPSPFCVTYIYRREIIGETRFPIDLAVGEDFVFIEEFLLKCNKVGEVDRIVYAYYSNPQSAMNYIDVEEKRLSFINSYFRSILLVAKIFELYNREKFSDFLQFRLEFRSYWFFKRAKDKQLPFNIVWNYRNNLPFNKFLFIGSSHLRSKAYRLRKIIFNNYFLFYVAYKVKSRKII